MPLYVKIEFPDIQEYMDEEWFESEVYYDDKANVWFVPQNRIYKEKK